MDVGKECASRTRHLTHCRGNAGLVMDVRRMDAFQSATFDIIIEKGQSRCLTGPLSPIPYVPSQRNMRHGVPIIRYLR
jgi:hypothetical protein